MTETATIKQTELTRYAKALAKAGVLVWQIVIEPDGRHRIIVGKSEKENPESDWD